MNIGAWASGGDQVFVRINSFVNRRRRAGADTLRVSGAFGHSQVLVAAQENT
jgi:hypothetical protein